MWRRAPFLVVGGLLIALAAAATLSIQLKPGGYYPFTGTRITLQGFGVDSLLGNSETSTVTLSTSQSRRLVTAINSLSTATEYGCHENQTVFAISDTIRSKVVWTAAYFLCPAPGVLLLGSATVPRTGSCALLKQLSSDFPEGEAEGSKGAITEVCA